MTGHSLGAHRTKAFAVGCAIVLASIVPAAGADELFVSRRLTPAGEYTSGIEGPAVDPAGNLYVVNFRTNGTIGKVAAGATKSTLFAELPAGSRGNGIRIDRSRMYVADFKGHTVFAFDLEDPMPKVYFHSDTFNQPNDLAIAADGTLFASDPNFGLRTGQIWRIARGSDGKGQGEVMVADRKMGVTNGIDLSPDGDTLYVGESNTREAWAYRIEGAKLTGTRLVRTFDKAELDGLRTDIDGKIFVARPGNGTVAVISPQGELVREIRSVGKEPTNLTFGGADGKTVFVTQKAGDFIESFRVDRPGREPCLHGVQSACAGSTP